MNTELLFQLKRVARLCLGFIWIYLGLVSKILFPVPFEQEVVHKTGLYLSSPAFTIRIIGVFEIFLDHRSNDPGGDGGTDASGRAIRRNGQERGAIRSRMDSLADCINRKRKLT